MLTQIQIKLIFKHSLVDCGSTHQEGIHSIQPHKYSTQLTYTPVMLTLDTTILPLHLFRCQLAIDKISS